MILRAWVLSLISILELDEALNTRELSFPLAAWWPCRRPGQASTPWFPRCSPGKRKVRAKGRPEGGAKAGVYSALAVPRVALPGQCQGLYGHCQVASEVLQQATCPKGPSPPSWTRAQIPVQKPEPGHVFVSCGCCNKASKPGNLKQ